MRNISCCKTTEQIRNRTKTVTRRCGWWFLKPRDRVCLVEKGMGLKKGEKVERMCVIEIVSCRSEYLMNITKAECVLEGFPNMEPAEFVQMFCAMNHCYPDTSVNRIEFKYV